MKLVSVVICSSLFHPKILPKRPVSITLFPFKNPKGFQVFGSSTKGTGNISRSANMEPSGWVTCEGKKIRHASNSGQQHASYKDRVMPVFWWKNTSPNKNSKKSAQPWNNMNENNFSSAPKSCFCAKHQCLCHQTFGEIPVKKCHAAILFIFHMSFVVVFLL